MKEYPKIQTLFERDPQNLSRVIPTKFARPEFELINRWRVTEKIHGTNARLDFRHDPLDFRTWSYQVGGRTDKAQLTVEQHDVLISWAKDLLPAVQEAGTEHQVQSITLYGELYGKGIQKEGVLYNPDGLSIAFFDALVNDTTWMTQDTFAAFAADLALPQAYEFSDSWETVELVWLVKDQLPLSTHASKDLYIEGVVARPTVDLYNAKGERVITKLKGKDFGRSMRG